ncbi:hypothetical protein LCGC14_2361850, partial [marine sediment metagenome]
IDDWVIGGNPKSPGYVLDYEGTDDFVEFNPVPPILQMGTGEFSIEAWAKADAFTGSGSRIFAVGSAVNRYELYLTANAVVFSIDDNTTKTDCAWANMTDGNWHHYVAYRDNQADKLFLYVDGIERKNIANSTDLTIDESTTAAIGRLGGSAGLFWNGLIDGVRIYNRALLPSEVLDLYNFPNAMFQFRDRVIGKAPAVAGVLRRNLTLMGAGK